MVEHALRKTTPAANIQAQTAEQQFQMADEGKAPAIVAAADGRPIRMPERPGANVKDRALKDPAQKGRAPIPPTTPPATGPAASPPANATPTKLLNEAAGQGATEQPLGDTAQIGFELGETALSGGALAILDRMQVAVKTAPVTIVLVARERENLDPAQRARLLDQRITGLITALASRGIPAANLTVVWRPERTDPTIHRGPPGLQIIARLRVGG